MRAALLALLLLSVATLARAEDLTFDQAISLATRQSPYVRPHERELEARTSGDARLPWMTQNPTVLVEPGARVSPNVSTGPELLASVTQGFSLDGFGDSRRDAARRERDALDAETRAVALEQALEVARHWILLWGAQEALQLAREERDGAGTLRAQVARTVAAEERTRLDLADADAYVAEAEAQVVDAEGYVFELGIGLSIEVGLDPAQPIVAVGAPPELALAEGAGPEALARVDRLPEVVAARVATLAARAHAAEASASQGAYLIAGAAVQADQPGGFVASAVVGLVPPVFEHGERLSSVARGEAARLGEAERTARLEARLRVAEAVHEVEHSRERERVLTGGLVPAAASRVALQERAFGAGETTLFRVLDARRALLDARRRLSAAHAERVWAETKLALIVRAIRGARR